MLNIEIDGIWCNECKDIHQTLFWHDKYGFRNTDAGIRRSIENLAKKAPKLFRIDDLSEDEKRKVIDITVQSNIEDKSIIDADIGNCIICGYETQFISKKTRRHVCSDECLYKENGWI